MTDSFYAGLGIGQTSSNFNLERDMEVGGADRSSLGADTPSYSIFAGYNYGIKETPILIGAELSATNHNLEARKGEYTLRVIKHYTTTIQSNNSLGACLKMGITIKDLLIYAKAGISHTNFKMNFVNSNSRGEDPIMTHSKFTKTGTVLGGGIDYKINEKWMIGMEHATTNYSKLKLYTQEGNFKASPLFHTTLFKLTYLI